MFDRKDVTILINTCDDYEDCWELFFRLYKKYWPNHSLRIILNTESKSFSMDGLNIETFNLYNEDTDVSYGQRMLDHLDRIDTPFVIPFLDDYFLRSEVDYESIERCIEWLKSDERAAQFYFTQRVDDCYSKIENYPGFVKIDNIAPYKLNMTIGVWKTDVYKSFWSEYVSPWSWEYFSTINTYDNKYDFYAVAPDTKPLVDFGHKKGKPWGIVRGKWVVEDVKPLFDKEGIEVDYNKRGIYEEDDLSGMVTPAISKDDLIPIVGKRNYQSIHHFELAKKIYSKLGVHYYNDYFEYLRKEKR